MVRMLALLSHQREGAGCTQVSQRGGYTPPLISRAYLLFTESNLSQQTLGTYQTA